jgi:hypothetical protein
MKSNQLKTSKPPFRLAALAPLVAGLLSGTTADAAPVDSAVDGDWLTFAEPNYTTWAGGGLPGLEDTALISHTVRTDVDVSVTNDEEENTAADVQVNTGGTLDLWGGRFTLKQFTFNGGTLKAAQRTMRFLPTTILVNDVPGNTWGQTKNQNSKHAEIHTSTISGAGDLDVAPGHSGQLFQLDVTELGGTTGFTGNLNVTRWLGRYDTQSETDQAWLKINNSITKADASFGMSLNAVVRDWTEEGGGTAEPDDGISYNGYDMRDGDVEVWLTSLTIGALSVPPRATAYTYDELAAMSPGTANFLRSDGSDGTLGVNGTAIPFLMTDVTFDGTTSTATWNSNPDQQYFVYFSTDLINWAEIDDSFVSQGTSTTYTDAIVERFAKDELPVPDQGYYRVLKSNEN